jgi:diguanylate cyclase (GGDEF)-like protein
MGDQPLLIALVAVQFFVYSLGWAMAAHLTGRWAAVEGHFAMAWLLLSAGLMLYVPPWPAGSAPRNLADLMIIAAIALQHRGMALHWAQRPSDRGYLAILAIALLTVVLSLPLERGHGVRVANVCVGVAVSLVATVWLVWRRGRPSAPIFAAIVAGGYAVLAAALFARAVQAVTVAPSTKISIDAPGHLNVPFAILVMFIGGLINLAQIRLVLSRVVNQLTRQAQTDSLTGTMNRRGLMQCLEPLHLRARQAGHAYVILMIDVDHFKAINDRHGHAEGDEVLKRVAGGLRDGLRAGDVIARWGGEEFCVVLPRTELAEAHALAERLKLQIAADATPRVTVSIGVAESVVEMQRPEDVIRRADEALYRAKEAGRNRVVVAAAVVPA